MKPLEIVFLNRPSPDRIFRAWAEIEAAQRGMRLASLDIREGGRGWQGWGKPAR